MLEATDRVPARAAQHAPLAAHLTSTRVATEHLDPTWLGGKGAALARVVADGVPVPSCAVLTVEAYREVASDADLASFLEGVRAAPSDEPVPATDVDAATLRTTLQRLLVE